MYCPPAADLVENCSLDVLKTRVSGEGCKIGLFVSLVSGQWKRPRSAIGVVKSAELQFLDQW